MTEDVDVLIMEGAEDMVDRVARWVGGDALLPLLLLLLAVVVVVVVVVVVAVRLLLILP